MSQADHAARLRGLAEFASAMAKSYSQTAPHVALGYERNSVALTAGADAIEKYEKLRVFAEGLGGDGAEALDRVAVLERELAEARKRAAALEERLDAAVDAAMDVLEEKGDTNAEGN